MNGKSLDRLFHRFATRGDARALERVFDATAPDLMALARHLCRDTAEAEDVLQATFLSAMESARSYDASRPFLAWISGHLANHARAAHRRASKRPDNDSVSCEFARSAASEAGEREFLRAVANAVGGLPPTYRAVLEPHLTRSQTPAETARRLGISQNLARVRLFRGLRLLRRMLPAGFAAGALATLGPTRGLAAVRSEVTKHAVPLAHTFAATPLASSPAILGGVLMTGRIALGLLVLLVLVGGAWLVPWKRSTPLELTETALERGVESGMAKVDSAPAPVSSELGTKRIEAAGDYGMHFVGRVIDADTQRPLADAVVWTTPSGQVERERRAVSKADGRFEFRAPPAEEASLFIIAEDYAPMRVPLSETRRTQLYERTGRVQREGEVDLGTLALFRGAELSGRVVRAVDRQPVEGAELLLFLDRWYGVPATISEHVIGTTDAAGRMHFDGLAPPLPEAEANYLLMAISNQGLGWTRVASAEGRVRHVGIEIQIEPPGRLRVKVRDEYGNNLAGTRVECLPLMAPIEGNPDDLDRLDFFPAPPAFMRCFQVRTNENGSAAFERLIANPLAEGDYTARNRYRLRVIADGFPQHQEILTFRGLDGGEHEVILWSVLPSELVGRVVDGRGFPIESARLSLDEGALEARSGADGQFALTRPAEASATFTLRLEAIGFLSRSLEQRLQPGAELQDLGELVLFAPRPIEGTVVDDGGTPLVGISVSLWRPSGESCYMDGSETELDGRFRVSKATAGEWFLNATPSFGAEGFENLPRLTVQGGDTDVVVTLRRTEQRLGRVVIEVVDAVSAAEVDPAEVQLLACGPNSGRHGIPSRKPGWVTIDQVSPGAYELWIAATGYANTRVAFELGGNGEELRLLASLSASACLRGVLDFGSNPAPEKAYLKGQLVTEAGSTPGGPIWKENSRQRASTRVGPGQKFELAGLTPGTWQLELSARGYTLAETLVEARGGDVRELELKVRLGATVEFVPARTLGSGWFALDQWRDGSFVEDRLRSASEDPPRPLTLTVPAGELRWRARFISLPDGAELAAPVEGNLTLAAGETRRVVVPVEERGD